MALVDVGNMDYFNQFKKIISTHSNIDACAKECNNLTEKAVKSRAMNFAEWLRYNDEVFEKYACNKIGLSTLYNMFIDNTKP